MRARATLAGAACSLMLVGCAAVCDEYFEATDGPRHGARAVIGKVRARPDQALLAPPPKPECEVDVAEAKRLAALAPPRTDANADLALRIKLEYERECYRQAELRVRQQLRALQAVARQIVKDASGTEDAQH